ncbi:MAG TPA: Arc family DNA-binding protein [Thermoanaerobaculia bacterium]|nr:Arc family DNA-binding protein [Thermoanaerobaculia bacterium]
MASLTLKNIPPDLHRKLKRRAAEHGRSLNSEAIAALRVATAGERVDVEAFLARVRKLRAGVKGVVTDEEIREMKNAGRA